MTEVLLGLVVVLQLVTLGLVWHTRSRHPVAPPAERPAASPADAVPPATPVAAAAPAAAAAPPPASVPPVPSSLPPEERARAELVSTWEEVLRRSARAGLVGLPSAMEVVTHLENGGLPWLCHALGQALRELYVDADAVERSEVGARRALDQAASFVDGLDGSWALVVEPPRGVPVGGGEWVVDESHARALGNPVRNGVLQPLVVLRPALFDGERCVVEGEVA